MPIWAFIEVLINIQWSFRGDASDRGWYIKDPRLICISPYDCRDVRILLIKEKGSDGRIEEKENEKKERNIQSHGQYTLKPDSFITCVGDEGLVNDNVCTLKKVHMNRCVPPRSVKNTCLSWFV